MHSWNQISIQQLDSQVNALRVTRHCPILRAMNTFLPSDAPQYTVHETRLSLRLAHLHHDVQPILGDGSCLFRAFSFVMTGSEDSHLRMREAAVTNSSVCRASHGPNSGASGSQYTSWHE